MDFSRRSYLGYSGLAAASLLKSPGRTSAARETRSSELSASNENDIAYIHDGDDVQAKYDSMHRGLLWITEPTAINNPLVFNNPNISIVYAGHLIPRHDATGIVVTERTMFTNLSQSRSGRLVSDEDSVMKSDGVDGAHIKAHVSTSGAVEIAAPTGGGSGACWHFEDDDTSPINYVTGRFVATFGDGDGIKLTHTGAGSPDLNAWDVHLEARDNAGKGVNIADGVRGSAFVDVEANGGRGLDVTANQWLIRGCYSENNGEGPRLAGRMSVGWLLQNTNESPAVAPGLASGWWKATNMAYSDLQVGKDGGGLIVKTPDGDNYYRMRVDNDGEVVTDGPI